MTESRFPQFPSTPKVPERTERPGNRHALSARITRAAHDLSDIRRITKIKGEVLQARLDARTRETVVQIRTERGDIEVRLPPDTPPPQPGQQVEVEIQPARQQGRQPGQVVIRPAAEERHAAPVQEPPPQRPAATPVNVELGTPPPPRVTIDRPAAPPPDIVVRTAPVPGDIVRLVPLPAQEAALAAAPLPDLIAQAVIEPAVLKTQVVVTEAQTRTLTNTVNILQQPAESAKQNLAQNAPSLSPASDRPVTQSSAAAPPDETSAPTPRIKIALPSIKNLTLQKILGFIPVRADLSLAAPKLNIAQNEKLNPALVSGSALPAQKTSPFTAPFTDVRVESITPPQVQTPAPEEKSVLRLNAEVLRAKPLILQDQKPGTFTGVVTGVTPKSLPILALTLPRTGEIQHFAVQVPAESLAAGTQIQITPVTQGEAAAPTLTSPLPPLSSYLLPSPWPVMEEIYQTLAQTAPQTAQAFANTLPSPANAAQLTPAALFFIAAVRGGDLTGLLGDKAIDALRRDGRGGGLLNRLSSEGGLLSRMSAEPVSQDWRAITLPMFYEGDIQKIALYYKQDERSGDGEQSQGKQTRFIFNLTLDKIGDVQLDGLFRGARLDIILRTTSPFSQAVQADMRATYAKALRQTQVTGELSFQNQPEQWVRINVEDNPRLGVEA